MEQETRHSLKEALEVMRLHALREAPDECCGMVLGDGDVFRSSSYEIFLCTNIQNRLREEDPAKYVRDAGTAYTIDPEEQIQVMKHAREEGLNLIAIYHSHVEHEVYFSQEDNALATWGGEPLFPDTSYIILSVLGGTVRDTGIFLWDAGAGGFVRRDQAEQ